MMTSGARAIARSVTAVAAVVGYVALHTAITAAADLRAGERVRYASVLRWSVPALLLLLPALWLRRRRRAGMVQTAALVSRFAPERAWWYRPVFLALSGVGCLLFAGGFLAASTARQAQHPPSPPLALLLLATGLAAMGAGVLLLRHARPRAARSAARALLADGRAPVLYLRSFADDAASARPDDSRAYVRLHTREEEFAAALGALGPVIAVGRPGEQLPLLGAARFYLPLDDWQPTVLRLMAASRLIVLRLGAGDGLWWEVEQAVATQPARKLVLLAEGDLTELARRLDRHLPVPSGLAGAAGRAPRAVVVVGFGDDWAPRACPVGPAAAAGLPPAGRVRRAARTARSVLAEAMLPTPTQHLALAVATVLGHGSVRRRAMGWRTVVATMESWLKGFGLLLVLGLAAWPAVRVFQVFGPG
ncbi:transferase [Kitasatospora sp. NPDC057198]|uniref:transferase n=1 Tax=Kitasatospora sp. NPDC057198 TaxID=3346046 RepID=UPI00363C5A81